MDKYETLGIEYFFYNLMNLVEVRESLLDKLDHKIAKKINQQFKAKVPVNEIEGDWEDVLENFVEGEGSDFGFCIDAAGANGDFNIEIKNFGPVFWVEAQEFSTIKYFKNLKDAIDCVACEYGYYIDNIDQYRSDDDDEELVFEYEEDNDDEN